jgi:O-antigen/teichoic acid export membrane protein
MLADNAKHPTETQTAEHASFFRQSGWMMLANIFGGVLMWAVHFLSKKIPEGEYGNFGAFLALVMVLCPTIPLQMLMAQQTAKSLATGRRGELSGILRLMWWGTTLAWLAAAALFLIFQKTILGYWKITDPAGLYLTLLIILLGLWLPVFQGVLQGQQNFLWLGWSMMSSAVGRFGVAALAVLLLHAYSAGMMGGVLAGMLFGCGISLWQSHSVWRHPPADFDRRAFLAQVFPLVIGFFGFQIFFTVDTTFVKAYFSEQDAGFYVGAGTLARALMWLVLPLAAVMFPRIVHSAAKSQKSNLMWLVFVGTAILSIVGAASLSLIGPFIIPFVFKQSYVEVAASILPWYAFAMVPLALANVLLNNIFARPASALAPAVCIFGLALVYMFALTRFHGSLVTVLQVLGCFNLLLLAICAWFTWGRQPSPETP